MQRKRLLLLFLVVFGLGSDSTGVAATQPSVRLTELLVTRVVEHNGSPAFLRGMLNVETGFRPIDPAAFDPGVPIPVEALGKDLLHVTMWFAYDILGPETLANFDIILAPVVIGEGYYYTTSVVPEPRVDTGNLINISARSMITAGGEPLIGGFVIEERPRRVLIRGVGPTLSGLGVTEPLPDPVIALYRGGETMPFADNDDWDQQSDPGAIDAIEQAFTATGSFPLPRGTKDAAYLVELPPGLYTVHLSSQGPDSGTALLEIYSVP